MGTVSFGASVGNLYTLLRPSTRFQHPSTRLAPVSGFFKIASVYWTCTRLLDLHSATRPSTFYLTRASIKNSYTRPASVYYTCIRLLDSHP